MDRAQFLAEALEWNITPSKGWAEIVTDAHFSGQIYKDSLYSPKHLTQETATPNDIRMFLCDSSFDGMFAWIDKKGRVVPLEMGCHDKIAYTLLGDVRDIERTHARVSITCHSFDDAVQYVPRKNRSDAMLDAVVKTMYEKGETQWTFIREMKQKKT